MMPEEEAQHGLCDWEGGGGGVAIRLVKAKVPDSTLEEKHNVLDDLKALDIQRECSI